MQRDTQHPHSRLPLQAVKSYAIAAPADTHTRPASCTEVNCAAQANGWATEIDEADLDMGRRRAHYIRTASGRRFTEERTEIGLTRFIFSPGQTCFRDHTVPLGRDPFFLVLGGDHRGNPTRERFVHANADDWVDDFANHQDHIADRVNRG